MSLPSTVLGAVTGGASSLIMPLLAGGAVLSLGAAVVVGIHEHDAKIAAGIAAQQAAVAAQAQIDQDHLTIVGMAIEAQQAAARAAATNKLKEAINAAPSTNACATAPAIVALLRGANGGHGGSPAAATGNGVAVPSRTGAVAVDSNRR